MKYLLLMVLATMLVYGGCDDDDDGSGIDGMEVTAAQCKDAADNDGDGLVDCADTDCQGFIFCVDSGNGDTDTAECSGGDTQCEGDMVQHCVGGSWTDYDDCTVLDMTCVVLGGEAQCYGGGVDAGADS